MAEKLGSPRTTKFSIGTAELRVGPLTDAMRLKQENSVGLIDNATVEVAQESVDLTGGFPKVLVDTAVISQEASVVATLREYSRRNINIMLGEGVIEVASEPGDVYTTVSGTVAADTTALDVTDDLTSTLTVGDMIVIFGQTDSTSAQVTVALVAGVAIDVITLDPDTTTLFEYVAGDLVYKANEVAIGAISTTEYFAVQMLQLERSSGRPVGFDFWKASIGAGMTFATNADDFGSTELNLKLLQPAASEYAGVTDPLYHIRDIIPNNPTGIYFGGGDT